METISIEEWLDLCLETGIWTIPYYDVCDMTFEEVKEIITRG